MIDQYEIRARRAVLHMTQAQFAQKLGVTRQYLNKIESGKIEQISRSFERRYDTRFPERLINIRFKRGVMCPFCVDTELPPQRIDFGERDDSDSDVYQCRACKRKFTQREAFRLLDEKIPKHPDKRVAPDTQHSD